MKFRVDMKSSKTILVLGDALALLIVTLIGFARHNETGLSILPRLAAVFLPLVLSWYLLAPWFGLFHDEITRKPGLLWRPVFAMFFAGPLAVVLRGILLNASIVPVFALVLSVTSAAGLLIWRGLYVLIENRKRSL